MTPRFCTSCASGFVSRRRARSRTRDGLASEATGNPSAPEWIGRRVFRFAAGPGPLEKALRAQMAGTSAALVLCGPEDSPRGWMTVGRALQALLLEAEAAQGSRARS
ncbi:MAG: hypothetical protein H6723_10665 [Sandaracinus sp.]|nr:hypothetical protein [Sandaracinus sp.]